MEQGNSPETAVQVRIFSQSPQEFPSFKLCLLASESSQLSPLFRLESPAQSHRLLPRVKFTGLTTCQIWGQEGGRCRPYPKC